METKLTLRQGQDDKISAFQDEPWKMLQPFAG
jgi:hypothetical protein